MLVLLSIFGKQRESIHFANNSQTLSVQQRDQFILLLCGKKKLDILIIKTAIFLTAKEIFNIILPPDYANLIMRLFSSTFENLLWHSHVHMHTQLP